MRAHRDLLFRSQASGLTKNRSEDFVNLADVVQQGGSYDSLNIPSTKTRHLGNHTCLVGDPSGMTRGVGISCLDGSDHKFQELSVRLFELTGDFVELP